MLVWLLLLMYCMCMCRVLFYGCLKFICGWFMVLLISGVLKLSW